MEVDPPSSASWSASTAVTDLPIDRSPTASRRRRSVGACLERPVPVGQRDGQRRRHPGLQHPVRELVEPSFVHHARRGQRRRIVSRRVSVVVPRRGAAGDGESELDPGAGPCRSRAGPCVAGRPEPGGGGAARDGHLAAADAQRLRALAELEPQALGVPRVTVAPALHAAGTSRLQRSLTAFAFLIARQDCLGTATPSVTGVVAGAPPPGSPPPGGYRRAPGPVPPAGVCVTTISRVAVAALPAASVAVTVTVRVPAAA